MHYVLQAAREIQYLQLTISMKNHREGSVIKQGLEVTSKCSVTGLLCDFITTVLNTSNGYIAFFFAFFFSFISHPLSLQIFDILHLSAGLLLNMF